MNDTTTAPADLVLTLTRGELRRMLAEAVREGAELAARARGDRMTAAEVAEHFRVSLRTLRRSADRYPPADPDGTWRRAEVLRWERDREAA